MAQLWQGETEKAIENFPISGERVPVEVVRMLARVKAEAARVNAELGLLDTGRAERIAAAAEAVAAGDHDDQFPIDVFQTGSGTNTNTNVNEVVSSLAGEGVHPNDHVNMCQSSNDTFPTAVHLAALDAAVNDLLPALGTLAGSLEAKAAEFRDIVKPGRTHLMDAVPVTLGQEFAGYAAQIRLGIERVQGTLPHVGQIPLGGTATVFSAPDASTRPSRLACASNGSAGGRISRPVSATSRARTRAANSGCVLRPVPVAVPPSGIWPRPTTVDPTRRRPSRTCAA